MTVMVSTRMPEPLSQALSAAARARGITRSALLRGLAEDLVDLEDVPSMRAATPADVIEQLRQRQDDELEHLRRLTVG